MIIWVLESDGYSEEASSNCSVLGFFFCFCDAGECLWLHDLRLPEILWPLLWQKLPPCGLLCQPRPAHGDEPVAAAAPVGPNSTVPAAGRTVTMPRRLNVEGRLNGVWTTKVRMSVHDFGRRQTKDKISSVIRESTFLTVAEVMKIAIKIYILIW